MTFENGTFYRIESLQIVSVLSLELLIKEYQANTYNVSFHLVGFLFKYINRQLVLIIAMFLFGVTSGLLPITQDFIVFYLFGLVGGIGSGVLDIVQTVWLIEMWGEKSASIMQLSEFTYGLGIIAGPLLVQPYIFGKLGWLILKGLKCFLEGVSRARIFLRWCSIVSRDSQIVSWACFKRCDVT